MHYRIIATKVYEGSSRHAPVPAVELRLHIDDREATSLSWSEIEASLLQVTAASTGGVIQVAPPREDSPAGHFVCLLTGLLEYAGNSVSFSKVLPADDTGKVLVLVEYEDTQTVLYACELAAELLSGSGADAELLVWLQHLLDDFLAFSFPRRLDPNSRLLMRAARRLEIPVLNMDQPPFPSADPDEVIQNGLIQFGWGIHLQRCHGVQPVDLITEETEELVADRARLLPVLVDAGIPLPVQDLEFIRRNQVRRAQRSVERVGYPVTVRPRYNMSHAYYFNESSVFGPLMGESQVARAVRFLTEEEGSDVWVESCVAGSHYNFLVLGGEVIAVIKSEPPTIIGDGEHSIAWLANRRAEQAENSVDHRVWKTLAAGDAGENCRLQLSGLTVDSVPDQGVEVALRAEGSFYNGGSCQDVTDAVPEFFKALALKTAEVSGLSSLAGISMVINDQSGAAEFPNCAVTAVTPGPDLQIFAQPAAGDPHTVAERFLGQLFPAGSQGRIPIVSITGTNGKTTTSRMVAHILRQAGYKTGLACSEGVYLDGEMVAEGDLSGTWGAFRIFLDSTMEVGVLETAIGGMSMTGFAYDRCDVGICLNIAADHISGQGGIYSVEGIAERKQQVIERTSGTAVLNAEDPRCLAMCDHTQAQHTVLVAKSVVHPAITSHCESGGTAVVVEPPGLDGNLCVCNSSGITPLLALADIPATYKGAAFYNVENALFAIAAAMGLGLPREAIIAGLRSFTMSMEYTPGRLNFVDGLPFQIILDFAHNAHGIKAFCKFSNQLPVEGRRILMLVAGGGRSVAEIEANAAAASDSFDYFLCRDPSELRGYKPGDIAELLKAGLVKNGVSGNRVECFIDQETALKRALEIVGSGDLLVVLGKFHVEARDALEKYQDALQHDCTVH